MEYENQVITGVWSEKIHVVTEDYEITGFIFLPKTYKKNRVLSDILNGKKRFIAIKDSIIVHRNNPDRAVENHTFIQLNLNSIIMLRPVFE